MVKTVHISLSETRDTFRDAGIDSWDADARLLVQHVSKLSREDMFLDAGWILSAAEEKTLGDCVQRRLQREPVSRILGLRGFWKDVFRISPDTLDPRPETELLVEVALDHVEEEPARVLDLGTGSGCLLLSLLREWPEARGTGVDISAGALATAAENARALSLADRAAFVAGDWGALSLEALGGQKFDVVVSNPPYIAEGEIAGLEPEVSRYDPRAALSGGADGLAAYRAIIARLPELLTPSGHVFFEIGATQAAAVRDLLEKAGLAVVETAVDLAGHDRCLAARRP